MLLRLKAPAAEASGKQGQQVVYFLWRNSQSARNWVRPSNPNAVDQLAARTILTNATKRWPTLSGANRTSWNTYAASHLVTNRLGVQVRSTALGMYLRLNFYTQMRTAGATWVDTAPTSAVPAPLTGITSAESAGSNSVAFTITHAISPTTDLYVLGRMNTSVSDATNPQAESIFLISGVAADSVEALVASGSPVTFAGTRASGAPGDVDVVLYVLDQYGQLSQPFKRKIEVTAP